MMADPASRSVMISSIIPELGNNLSKRRQQEQRRTNQSTFLPEPAMKGVSKVGGMKSKKIIRLHHHFCPLEIITDSKYAIEGLTMHLQNWEDQGPIKIKNTRLFQKAACLLRR